MKRKRDRLNDGEKDSNNIEGGQKKVSSPKRDQKKKKKKGGNNIAVGESELVQ